MDAELSAHLLNVSNTASTLLTYSSTECSYGTWHNEDLQNKGRLNLPKFMLLIPISREIYQGHGAAAIFVEIILYN